MYDVIIAGGGTAGCACAYIASKAGLKTLLIERNIHLGGTITSGFVQPAMKTDTQNINCEFYNDFVEKMKKYNAQITYSDGNSGWFNPEIAKIVLDEMLIENGCEILLDTEVVDVETDENKIKKIKCNHKTLSSYCEAKYFVDSTGDGNFSLICKNEILPDENSIQAMTLRFLISGIDLKKFKNWLEEIDKDHNVTNFAEIDGQIHLTTAYTWDDKPWGLHPIFEEALQSGDLEEADTAYFQLFTVAGMPNTVTMNCPRILSDKNLDPLDSLDISKALITGRKQVFRIHNFCKKYFPGFENSFISNIADMLGIRESRRIRGEYIYSEKDIVSNKTLENPAFTSNYPIDVHSNKKDDSVLEFVPHTYQVPLEVLKSANYDNLYIIGRCLSATFKAQAALRIQPCCFAMGEAVAKDIAGKLS